MKLKSLHIQSYRHLENLDFDFTYPEGHEKAGEPLEKICIMGQSATGKTSILELIKDAYVILKDLEIIDRTQKMFRHYRLNFRGDIVFSTEAGVLKMYDSKIINSEIEYTNLDGNGGGSVGYLIPNDLKLIYLSSEIISKEAINIFNKNPLEINTEFSTDKYLNEQVYFRQLNGNYIYEFMQHIDETIWFSLLHKILNYRKRFTQMASELINKGAIGDINKLTNQYSKWAKDNENPLDLFATFFNPILDKLNLEVDLINTEYSIPIKSKLNDEIIPLSSLSTGTKGLLLSMFPVFELNTKDAIILLDEPERSLFPDMQIDLISHYQNLAPEAQFVVATHSPFIAAAFEPEERFILYFNEKGKVQLRRGESPIGDDPNDMLNNDFNVDYYNQFGKAAHKKYLDLKREVAQETKPQRKKELIVELAELGDKYNF